MAHTISAHRWWQNDFKTTRDKCYEHHQQINQRVGSINREETPEIWACVQTPYFSDVVAARKERDDLEKTARNSHWTWALLDDRIQFPAEEKKSEQAAFVDSKYEHETARWGTNCYEKQKNKDGAKHFAGRANIKMT
jgi:hypothetical protein